MPTGMIVHLASTDEERSKCFWLQGSDCFISNTGKLRGSARLYYNLMNEQGILYFIFILLELRLKCFCFLLPGTLLPPSRTQIT